MIFDLEATRLITTRHALASHPNGLWVGQDSIYTCELCRRPFCQELGGSAWRCWVCRWRIRREQNHDVG